jgi:hypothetical protein
VLFLVFFIEGCFGWPSDDFYVVEEKRKLIWMQGF